MCNSGANRFLWPGIFVNSSTVPHNIVTERQKQKEMVCAQNLMYSRNDGRRKNHIDDGEQTVATTDDREEQSKIYHNIQSPETIRCTMVLVSFSGSWSFPRNRRPRFTHDNDEKSTIFTTKHANRPKSGLTMTVNTGRLLRIINNLQ